MSRLQWILCLGLGLLLAGCGGHSSPAPINCNELTASQCLEADVESFCTGKLADFEDTCNDILKAESNAAKTEYTLIPELTAFDDTVEDTIRDRYVVKYKNQPFLFIPRESTPSSYFMRSAQYGLMNINDLLANGNIHSDDFSSLEPDPALVLPRSGKSKAVTDFSVLPQPAIELNPNYMFEGLRYTVDILNDYFDSLYTGKVGEWNDNGNRVESCEEYTYEKFYDFSLFKDFMALHQDDHLRIVDYAFRDVTVDADGNPDIIESDIKPGAIGTRILYHTEMIPGNLHDLVERKGADTNSVDPKSSFMEPFLSYGPRSGNPSYFFYSMASPELSTSVYFDNEMTPNPPNPDCNLAWLQCIDPKDPFPKNFFIEVMGKIRHDNQDRRKGVLLSNTDLLNVYDQDNFEFAQECYGHSFMFHYQMSQAAKRMYPDTRTLKAKLNEFKMLRRHLIELLAERSRYESLTIQENLLGWGSNSMLRSSRTLPLSEKEFAERRLDEYALGHESYSDDSQAKAVTLIDITDPIQMVNVLAELDDQIEAVLLDAKERGCLATDLYIAPQTYGTNYVTKYDSYGDMLIYLAGNATYDKVLCDWTPEMFTVDAADFIPDDVYENVYDECKRITANDFAEAHVAGFQFKFPSACSEPLEDMFNAWSPNNWVDYTVDTLKFYEFENLVKAYPSALLDCDNKIQQDTLNSLKEADMNYFDPISGAIMMSKSMSDYYDGIGGEYAGLDFGYSLGWLYEGYENVDTISDNDANRAALGSEVCTNTNFFAFGNYFAGGSFLKKDFTLCSAGSYASNKTADGGRPVPPTLADNELASHINEDIQTVATKYNVSTNYFMFIKNEKMTFTYDSSGFHENDPAIVDYSEPYYQNVVDYQNTAQSDAQMFLVEMQQSVPVCGIISITIKGKVSGDIDAESYVTGDTLGNFGDNNACKELDFNFTPYFDFDGFASASVTAGISGVASISAGVELGLKFAHIRFPYNANLSVSQDNGPEVDADFNYDIWVKANNSLEQETTLLSGFFGAFIKLDYLIGSDTYHQKLFSWDGITFNGTIDSLGNQDEPFVAPIRALNGLANLRYDTP